MFQIISRRIFTYLTASAVVVAFVLVSAALLTQCVRYIDLLLGKSIGVGDYLSLISYLIPNLAAIVLPLCVTIAIIYTFSRMSNDNELVIFKASGLSNAKIMKPVLLFGLLFTFISAYLHNYLEPLSSAAFKNNKNQISHNFSFDLIREGTFAQFNNMTVYVKERDQNDRLKMIFIQDKASKNEYVSFVAQHGLLTKRNNNNVIILYNGCRQEINQENNQHTIIYFNELVYSLTQEPVQRKLTQARTKPGFWQLLNPTKNLDQQQRMSQIIAAHKRIVYPALVFALSVLGAAMLIAGQYARRGRWRLSLSFAAISFGVQIFIISTINIKNKGLIYILNVYILLLLMVAVAAYLVFLHPTFLKQRLLKRVHS